MSSLFLLGLAAAPLLQAPADPTDSTPGENVLLPAGVSPERLAELANTLLVDEPGDGRTWARGATYKASFGPEGFTYRPFLGSDAPRAYPVEFDLSRVTVGEVPLELGARERSRVESTVVLDRGSMHESYHLAERSVEQTFVFDALPVAGEIALEMEVTTDLAGRVSGDGFVFEGELGAVQYGAATAIDADGRARLLEQTLEGGVLRIVVPRDFVQSARLPLVVDPILSTLSVSTSTRRQIDVDVAYEGNSTNYQIVFSQIESGLDQDVISVLYSASLDLLLPPRSIDITSTSWASPANASAYGPGTFLCAAVTGTTIGSRRVRGRTLGASTGTLSAQFDISGFGGETVDVGGKGNGVNSVYDFLVVWQEADNINFDMDIVAQAVDDDGTLTGGRVVIDGDVGDLDRKPAISKSSGRPGTSNAENEYMIVWEREQSATNHDLRCQVVEYTGSMSGHNQFSGYTFSDALDPDVSSWHYHLRAGVGTKVWSLVFERRTGTDYDIFAVVAEDGNAFNARNLQVMQDLDVDLDQRDPKIAFDSSDYLVAYQTERAGGDRTVEFTAFNVLEQGGELRVGLCLRRETLGTFPGGAANFGLASHWEGGGPNSGQEPGDAFVAFQSRPTAADDEDLAGAVIAEVRGFVYAWQYCGSEVNSSGESAWMWGTMLLGDVRLYCESLPAGQFGIFVVSQNSGFIPNPGGSNGNLCLQGAIGRYNGPGQVQSTGPDGTMSLAADRDQIPLPTGAVAMQPGETWYFQAWVREPGGQSNYSNGIGIER